MRIKYTLEVADMVAFHRHFMSKPMGRALRRRNFFVGSAVAPLVSLLFLGMGVEIYAMAVVVMLIVYAALFFLLSGVLSRMSARQIAKAADQPGVYGEHEIELSDDEVVETTSVNKNHYRWSGIVEIERTSEFLLFWLNAMTAHIVPLRAFESPKAAEDFERNARQFKSGTPSAAA